MHASRSHRTDQIYFKDLEFEVFDIPCLETIEMAAEKVRAAFQRAKVRDFYDLHLLTKQKLDGQVLRSLVVLKLWQVTDAFDGAIFFERLKSASYDWDDLKRLLRPKERIRASHDHRALELDVVADGRKGARNIPLGNQLRDSIRRRLKSLV